MVITGRSRKPLGGNATWVRIPSSPPNETAASNCGGIRGISAVGSAPHWQCGGQGFDSPILHQKTVDYEIKSTAFFFKGDEYEILYIAKHTEPVERDGKIYKRFEYI